MYTSFWLPASYFILQGSSNLWNTILEGMVIKSSSGNPGHSREVRSGHGAINENAERGNRAEGAGSRIFIGDRSWGYPFGCRRE
jgi:hypothetical protein